MKGIYVLAISIDRDILVKVGKLGSIKFDKGLFAYVGSAQNNVKKRVERHLSKQKKTFWHIDYLLANKHAKIMKVFFKNADRPEECKLAGKLFKNSSPITGFGSSDCKCISHMYKIRGYQSLREQMIEKRWGQLGQRRVK